jgi:hypothetical protein
MMHLLCKVDWDTDGEPLSQCDLVETVIVLDAPADWESEEYHDVLGERLSDAFNFCHHGFTVEPLLPMQGDRISPVAVIPSPAWPLDG